MISPAGKPASGRFRQLQAEPAAAHFDRSSANFTGAQATSDSATASAVQIAASLTIACPGIGYGRHGGAYRGSGRRAKRLQDG